MHLVTFLLFLIIGQTPIMLAEDDDMKLFLKNYQQDIQYTGPNTKHWQFQGAWYKNGKRLVIFTSLFLSMGMLDSNNLFLNTVNHDAPMR